MTYYPLSILLSSHHLRYMYLYACGRPVQLSAVLKNGQQTMHMLSPHGHISHLFYPLILLLHPSDLSVRPARFLLLKLDICTA